MGTHSAADVEQRAIEDRVRQLWNRPAGPDDTSLADLGPGSSPNHRGLCTQHGIVLLNELAPNGCPECEAIRAKAGGGPEALQRWAVEVDVPPDASLVVLVDPEPMLVALYGERASGFRTETLGVAVSGNPEDHDALMPFYGSPLGTVQIWAQRAIHAGSGIVSEIRWHPERAPLNVIWNPQLPTYSDDLEVARRGLELIVEGERVRNAAGGARRGPKLKNFPTRVREFCEDYRQKNGKPAPVKDICVEFKWADENRFYQVQREIWATDPTWVR